jgi:hypothetical protein
MLTVHCPLCTAPMSLARKLGSGARFACGPCTREFEITMITDPKCVDCGAPVEAGNEVCVPCFCDNHLPAEVQS